MRPHAGGYVVKLVRDRVPDLLGLHGIVSYEPLNRETHVQRLRAKLIEEAAEYVTSPSVGELADVLEAVRALANVDLQVGMVEVEEVRQAKWDERGGFTDGMGMIAFHPAYDAPDGGEVRS